MSSGERVLAWLRCVSRSMGITAMQRHVSARIDTSEGVHDGRVDRGTSFWWKLSTVTHGVM